LSLSTPLDLERDDPNLSDARATLHPIVDFHFELTRVFY